MRGHARNSVGVRGQHNGPLPRGAPGGGGESDRAASPPAAEGSGIKSGCRGPLAEMRKNSRRRPNLRLDFPAPAHQRCEVSTFLEVSLTGRRSSSRDRRILRTPSVSGESYTRSARAQSRYRGNPAPTPKNERVDRS